MLVKGITVFRSCSGAFILSEGALVSKAFKFCDRHFNSEKLITCHTLATFRTFILTIILHLKVVRSTELSYEVPSSSLNLRAHKLCDLSFYHKTPLTISRLVEGEHRSFVQWRSISCLICKLSLCLLNLKNFNTLSKMVSYQRASKRTTVVENYVANPLLAH